MKINSRKVSLSLFQEILTFAAILLLDFYKDVMLSIDFNTVFPLVNCIWYITQPFNATLNRARRLSEEIQYIPI